MPTEKYNSHYKGVGGNLQGEHHRFSQTEQFDLALFKLHKKPSERLMVPIKTLMRPRKGLTFV